MAQRITLLLLAIAIFAGGVFLGVRNWRWFEADVTQTAASEQSPQIESIVAQGRLLPLNGIVDIPMPPGQRLESVLVAVGDPVVAGQTELAIVEGRDMLQLQVDLAEARQADAALEIEQQITAAEINLRTAEAAHETANLNLEQLRMGTDRQIAEKQIQAARDKLERMRRLAENELTKNLISQQDIDDQSLLLEKAEADLKRADKTLEQNLEAAELAAQNARLNVESAQKSLELAQKMAGGNRSLQVARTVAEKQRDNSRIVAPSNGTVLDVFVEKGEAAVNTPLMQIGDLSQMVCIAEVNDRLVRRVQPGQRAVIKSAALTRDLNGTVRSVGRIVGSNTLPNPSPLAMVDVKTVEVQIEMDATDTAEAANFVRLQVTVEIEPSASTPPPSEPAVETAEPR